MILLLGIDIKEGISKDSVFSCVSTGVSPVRRYKKSVFEKQFQRRGWKIYRRCKKMLVIDRLLVNHPGVYASKGCFERRGGGTRNQSREAFNSSIECLKKTRSKSNGRRMKATKAEKNLVFVKKESRQRKVHRRRRRLLKKRYKEYSRSFVKDFLCFWFYFWSPPPVSLLFP